MTISNKKKDPPGISVGSGGSDGEFLDKGMVESDGNLKNFSSYLKYFESLRFVFLKEPGYYETGSFGIRLETDLEVVEADVPVNNDYSIKCIKL